MSTSSSIAQTYHHSVMVRNVFDVMLHDSNNLLYLSASKIGCVYKDTRANVLTHERECIIIKLRPILQPLLDAQETMKSQIVQLTAEVQHLRLVLEQQQLDYQRNLANGDSSSAHSVDVVFDDLNVDSSHNNRKPDNRPSSSANTKLCRFHAAGFCKKGDHCNYSHDSYF
jgi:hypothetical protein